MKIKKLRKNDEVTFLTKDGREIIVGLSDTGSIILSGASEDVVFSVIWTKDNQIIFTEE